MVRSYENEIQAQPIYSEYITKYVEFLVMLGFKSTYYYLKGRGDRLIHDDIENLGFGEFSVLSHQFIKQDIASAN